MKNLLVYFIFFVGLPSCTTLYVSEIAESQTKIDATYCGQDSLTNAMILPYREQLAQTMDEILVQAKQDLIKAKPESSLGNLLADATFEIANKYATKNVDLAILNYGGIRVPSINKGAVTLGNVYELMPFDNYLVIIEVEGGILQELCNKIAAGGGWPISHLSFKIKEGKAVEVMVNESALVLNKVYTVGISDYLANGGDNLDMLIGVSQENTNVLLRDAFIEYFRLLHKEGAQLEARVEGRILGDE